MLGNIRRMENDGWQRFHFEGHPASREEARRARLRVYESWVASVAQEPAPLRIPLNTSGPLAFLMRRQTVRDLRSVAARHAVGVLSESRFNPRWVELRPSPSRS